MFQNAIADIKASSMKLDGQGVLKKIFYLCIMQELCAVLIYRFGRWARYQCNLPIIKWAMRILYIFLSIISEVVFHVYISTEYEIGPGLRLEHFGYRGIVAKIGRNCRIQQLVVMGHTGAFRGGGVPTLGDNVYVGVGAKILGEVNIGHNVIIGANAVVTKDIPDNAVAVGIPARVVKIQNDTRYNEKFI